MGGKREVSVGPGVGWGLITVQPGGAAARVIAGLAIAVAGLVATADPGTAIFGEGVASGAVAGGDVGACDWQAPSRRPRMRIGTNDRRSMNSPVRAEATDPAVLQSPIVPAKWVDTQVDPYE